MNNQITAATNLTGPDLSSSNDARKYFNNFYSTDFSTSSQANDAIISFFEQYSGNALTAKNMAAAVIYTALAQKLDPMTVLQDFQKLNKGELNNYLAAFLNINRSPTSVLAVKNTTIVNPLISRTVLV